MSGAELWPPRKIDCRNGFFSKAAVFISEGIYSALSCRFVGLFIYLGGLRELTEPVYPGANN